MFEYRKYHWCYRQRVQCDSRQKGKERACRQEVKETKAFSTSVCARTKQAWKSSPSQTYCKQKIRGDSARHIPWGNGRPLLWLWPRSPATGSVNSEERFLCSRLSIHSFTLDFLTYFPNWISLKQSSQVKLMVPQMWWQGRENVELLFPAFIISTY